MGTVTLSIWTWNTFKTVVSVSGTRQRRTRTEISSQMRTRRRNLDTILQVVHGMPLYSANPAALINARDATGVADAKDALGLARAAATINDWFGVFSEKEIGELTSAAALATSPDEREDIIQRFETMFKPAIEASS